MDVDIWLHVEEHEEVDTFSATLVTSCGLLMTKLPDPLKLKVAPEKSKTGALDEEVAFGLAVDEKVVETLV